MRHELAACAEHLDVDVHVVRWREEQYELSPELGQHLPKPLLVVHSHPELAAEQRRLLDDGGADLSLGRGHRISPCLGSPVASRARSSSSYIRRSGPGPAAPSCRRSAGRCSSGPGASLARMPPSRRSSWTASSPRAVLVVVVAAATATATRPVAARGDDVPHKDLVSEVWESARPPQPRRQAVPSQGGDAIGEPPRARLEGEEHGSADLPCQVLGPSPLLALPPWLHQAQRQPRQQVPHPRSVVEPLEEHIFAEIVLPVIHLGRRDVLLPPEVAAAPVVPGPLVAHAAVHGLDVHHPVAVEDDNRLEKLERR